MTKTETILIHVLAVHPAAGNEVHARATLRLGYPSSGDVVWFQGTDHARHELTVVDVRRTSRLWTIVLSGEESDLVHLVGGAYLYGKDN